MADISKGKSFSDGDTVHGADLNTLVDAAVILDAFITLKGPVTPANDDYVVIHDSSASGLAKARVDAIPGVANVAFSCTIPGTTVTNVTPTGPNVSIALQNNIAHTPGQFLASPAGASGVSSYREIQSRDMAIPVVIIPEFLVDWTLSNYFYKAITTAAGNNFSFTGGADGQSIYVELGQGGAAFTVAWPASTLWDNHTVPVLSPGAGRIDLYQFWFLGGNLFGKRIITAAHA